MAESITIDGTVGLAIAGGDGNDTLTGGAGRDILSGDDGYHILRGEAGAEQLRCGPGDDNLYAYWAVTNMVGGSVTYTL